MLPRASETWTIFEAAHLLNRAGFGGSPAEIKAFHALGRDKAVDSLIAPTEPLDAFPAPAWSTDEQALADMKARRMEIREARKAARGLSPEEAEKAKREAIQGDPAGKPPAGPRRPGMVVPPDAQDRGSAARENDALLARPFRHLDPEGETAGPDDACRTSCSASSAFGSFKDLTQAILMDPAMMLYLDTQSSQKGKPNENFAREVMELFTLGEGNYTEQDIREAARAFTGYQLNRITGKVTHNRRQWDDADKTVFGKTGPFTGKDVINLIFEKPDAARFMAKKIWEFFVYDNPVRRRHRRARRELPQGGYPDRAAAAGDFPVARNSTPRPPSARRSNRPSSSSSQLLKQLEIAEPPAGFPITAQQQLGQVLFMPPNVAGWDWGQAWINTNTLLTRYNLAGFLTKGAGEGGKCHGHGERMKTPGMAPGPNAHGPRLARARTMRKSPPARCAKIPPNSSIPSSSAFSKARFPTRPAAPSSNTPPPRKASSSPTRKPPSSATSCSAPPTISSAES